jgi:ABC-type sugar transport system substrate-binding protein
MIDTTKQESFGKEKIKYREELFMKRKLLGVLLCAAVTTTMFAGCGDSGSDAKSTSGTSEVSTSGSGAKSESGDDNSASGDMITVGFAQVGHESDWRTASTKSCQDVFSKENGYDLQFVDCDNDSAVQLEAVRNFIEQDVDYIIIDPIVSTGWDTVLTECEDAGIPVIVIDRTIDDSDKYAAWVGSNFKTEGVAAGEWLKAYAAEKGISEINALVIEGSTGASATIGRTDGFKEVADREGWTILDSQSGDFTQDGGQEVMESYIKSYEGKFNVVICQNDNEAFGAMDAMKAAGVSYGVDGDVILVSFDACTAGLEYVMSGDINADFECNPLAAPAVEEVIKTLASGGTPEKEVYMTEHWYVNEDIVKSIEVNGETQEMTVVTQEIIDAQY